MRDIVVFVYGGTKRTAVHIIILTIGTYAVLAY